MLFVFDDTYAPRFDGDRGVYFRLRDTESNAQLLCLVSREALEDKAAASGMHESDLIGTFFAFRGQIERIAVEKYAADGNAAPVVLTADLN